MHHYYPYNHVYPLNIHKTVPHTINCLKFVKTDCIIGITGKLIV